MAAHIRSGGEARSCRNIVVVLEFTDPNLMLELTGGRNIASNLSEAYLHVNSESIITENPDVMMEYVCSSEVDRGWNSTEKPEALVAEVLNRDGWESIEAVKNQWVYLVSNELMTGLDSVVGYLYWVKLFHPDSAMKNILPILWAWSFQT